MCKTRTAVDIPPGLPICRTATADALEIIGFAGTNRQ
jgi:hypothetical protein